MLMQAMLFMAAATVCLYLLRSAWRVLVEVPDADQVWAPDVVEGLLTRLVSASLLATSGLLLVMMVRSVG